MRIIFCILMLIPAIATAGEDVYRVTIKNHVFEPAHIEIPANKKVKIIINNEDPTPEEFESHDLHREKVISGNSTGTVLVGPLKKGQYKFFGEFHQDTAKGIIEAI